MVDLASLRLWGEAQATTIAQTLQSAIERHRDVLPHQIMAPITRLAYLLAALAPFAAGDAPPALPRITDVRFSGNGCPQGSNSASRTGEWGNLGFRFSGFRAASGTQNCQAHITSDGASPGWQVGVNDVTTNGHIVVRGGRVDYYSTSFWSESAARTLTMEETISNNQDGPITIHTNAGDDRVTWSKCIGDGGSPGILNINLRAVATDGNSLEVNTEYVGFSWRRC